MTDKTGVLQGLGLTIEQHLPPGEAFVLLTFREDGEGKYHDITNTTRRDLAVKQLRKCADVLEQRREIHIPPGARFGGSAKP